MAPPTYHRNYILSDGDVWGFKNGLNALGTGGIRGFIAGRGGRLLERVADAADTIEHAAEEHDINPQWVLATLQKEQSLLTRKAFNKRSLEYSMGYGATDSHDIPKYKGYETQVRSACWGARKGILWKLGQANKNRTLDIDDTPVVPVNAATAMCYAYTPHLHGNRSLWTIWGDFFGHEQFKPKPKVVEAGKTYVEYPSGLRVKLRDGGFMRPTQDEWVSRVSADFSLHEYRCRNGAPELKLDPKLVELDQMIRDAVGKPVVVASGYRTPEYNERVGGAAKSQHKYGRASDLVPTAGVATRDLYRIAKSLDPGGLGGYSSFVHVDVRGGKKARWGKSW